VKTHFTSSGAEIKSIIILATEAELVSLKVMLKPNIVLLLMFTFKLRLHLQTKVVILNASEKEKL
jgi:hypothetical protein